ncbi:MAG: J domain-containing protein [Hyphomicrobiaceae bacterium]
MFERNRVDNASVMTVAVEISLDDGSTVTGRAALPQSRAVHKLLDGPDAFIFIDRFDGESAFIPKASIKALKLVMPTRLQPLHLLVTDATQFDPYKVLGLAKAASWDEIRAAYHALTKTYHPDLFAAVALPPEVARYLDSRTKQLNAAFRLLKASNAATRA